MLYYAVGDVHGCANALERLLRDIARHKQARYGAREHRIVMLGDYVDRGPDSARVLDLCLELEADGHVVLPGNHDQMMHDALGARSGARAAAHWWANGARATLKSYGATDLPERARRETFRLVPERHRALLQRMIEARAPYHLDAEDRLFFVHAGVRPQESLARQSRTDLLWSRDPDFYGDAPVPWVEGLRVVHAHTPGSGPEVRANRVGLDTGAVYGGRLSAGVFVDGELEDVLSTEGGR